MRSPPSSHFAPGVDLSFSPLLLWLFHSRGGLFPHEVICPSGPDPPARAILSRAVLIPRRESSTALRLSRPQLGGFCFQLK